MTGPFSEKPDAPTMNKLWALAKALKEAVRSAKGDGPPDAPCSRCHEGTGFEFSVENMEYLSVCCGARAERLDAEPDDA